MEEKRIIDEFGVILVGVQRHRACGGVLPLSTQDETTAMVLRTWIIDKLIPLSKLQFTVSEPYLDELMYYVNLRLVV